MLQENITEVSGACILAKNETILQRRSLTIYYQIAITGFVAVYFIEPAGVRQEIGINRILRTAEVGFVLLTQSFSRISHLTFQVRLPILSSSK